MAENIDEVKKKVKEFIIQDFMFGKGELKDEELLFESGIIDSLGFIKLLSFIEKTFNISFNMSEIVIEKLNTVNSIVNTILSKKGTT